VREWATPRHQRIGAVAWSPDGSEVALTTEDDSLTVCDAESGKVRWEAKGDTGARWGLAWNGPLRLLAAQAQPDVIILYSAADGAEILHINTPNDASATTAFSSDGLMLATCTERFGTRLFHATTGRMLTADSAPSWHLHFDRASPRLGTLFDNGRPAWLEWLPSTAMQSLSAAVSSGNNQVLNFSPDGHWLVSLTVDRPVIWDLRRGKRLVTPKIQNAVYALFAPDSQSIWVSSGGSLMELELAALLKPVNEGIVDLPPPFKIASGTGFWGIASSTSRELIAVADHKGHSVQLLDKQRRLLRKLAPSRFPAYLQFSPDGRWLAVASGDEIFISDIDSVETPPKRLPGGEPAPKFSPDGQWLLPLGKEPKLWQTGTWQPGPPLPIEPNNTSGAVAAFSPDGSWLAITQRDREIHLIDFATRQTVAIFEGPGEGPRG
jgi:WD40 repeat protein